MSRLGEDWEEEEEKEEEEKEEEDDEGYKLELLATTAILHASLNALPAETQKTLHGYCKSNLGAFLLYVTNVMKLPTLDAMIAANFFLGYYNNNNNNNNNDSENH